MTKELHTRICLNCGNKSHEFCEPLSQPWMKTLLKEYCGLCSKLKGHYAYFWWGNGTPVGHEKQLTPEQSKYIVEDKKFKQLIMYQDDLVKSAKSVKKYLKRLKPTDEYVRGYKDAKYIIDVFMEDVIDVLKAQLYCNDCQEYPAEHTVGLGLDPCNFYSGDNLHEQTEEYVEVCEKCYNKQYKKR